MPPRRSPLEKALHGPDGDGDTNESEDVSKSNPPGRRGGVSAGGSTGRSGEALVDTTRPGHNPAHQRTVFKQEVDRTNTLNPAMSRQVKDAGGTPKPYDSAKLRDVASNDVVQAYIDTLAQDVASARWQLKPRDEDATIGDEEVVDLQRKMEDLHPEKSFRDILEQTTRNLLELGDAAWVKHYYSTGDELAEVVPVDSAKMFKAVDEHGLTEKYLQAQLSNLSISAELEVDEIVWFEWSSRTDHVYGHGPVEKGLQTIQLLNELGQKEEKDLREGMPPGIVSAAEDPDNPLPMDEFETVKEEFQMAEGERHRVLVSRGDWDYTDFSGNYQELEILPRSKFHINVLGAVFKCNAPYAGFDFQEGNKAQNQAQKEAYAQRGFRQTLRQVEEAITRQLVHKDLSEELIFEFEREQTTTERNEQAEYLQQAAEAAEAWANNGKTVTITEDGLINVEAGDVAPEDVETEDPPGGGGLPFSAGEETPPDTEEEDKAEVRLSMDEVEKADEVLLTAYKRQIWPESVNDIEKAAWDESDSVPDYVIEQVKRAIDKGAVFDAIESVPKKAREEVEALLADKLTQPQGWSLDSLVDEAGEIFPGVGEEQLEVVMRTETASVLNTAREEGYESREESGRFKFKWQGPDDQRTTDACTALKEATNPDYGGTPMSMPDLKRKEEEVAKEHFPNLSHRDHTLHPNERHTFVRVVDV